MTMGQRWNKVLHVSKDHCDLCPLFFVQFQWLFPLALANQWFALFLNSEIESIWKVRCQVIKPITHFSTCQTKQNICQFPLLKTQWKEQKFIYTEIHNFTKEPNLSINNCNIKWKRLLEDIQHKLWSKKMSTRQMESMLRMLITFTSFECHAISMSCKFV